MVGGSICCLWKMFQTDMLQQGTRHEQRVRQSWCGMVVSLLIIQNAVAIACFLLLALEFMLTEPRFIDLGRPELTFLVHVRVRLHIYTSPYQPDFLSKRIRVRLKWT